MAVALGCSESSSGQMLHGRQGKQGDILRGEVAISVTSPHSRTQAGKLRLSLIDCIWIAERLGTGFDCAYLVGTTRVEAC